MANQSRHYEDNPHRGLTEGAYVDILNAIQSDHTQLGRLLADVHPADIADLIGRLPRANRQIVVSNIPSEHLGEVIAELDEGVQEHVLQLLHPEEVQLVINNLESDDAADLAQTMEDMADDEGPDAEDLLHDPQQKHLLNFEPDTAGGLMQLEVVAGLPTDTVQQSLTFLREHQDELPNNPGTVFVVNRQRKLLGTVSMGRLLKAPLKSTLEETMRRTPLTVQPEVSSDEVVKIFEKYDIHNLAVVNKRNQLLGRITIDDILDVVMADAAYRQSAAAGVDSTQDMFAPAASTALHRLPWLIVNLGTAVLAASVIALFEDSIAKLTTLAVLMPIVASMGGNATTQTQTVIIRGLATGQITRQNAWALFKKEAAAGSYNGTIMALLMALGTWFIYGSGMLALVIALATLANHFIAALGGWLTPLLLKRFNYDPAISTGVITTTFTDVGGFFVFLGLATLLLM